MRAVRQGVAPVCAAPCGRIGESPRSAQLCGRIGEVSRCSDSWSAALLGPVACRKYRRDASPPGVRGSIRPARAGPAVSSTGNLSHGPMWHLNGLVLWAGRRPRAHSTSRERAARLFRRGAARGQLTSTHNLHSSNVSHAVMHVKWAYLYVYFVGYAVGPFLSNNITINIAFKRSARLGR